MLSLLLTVAVAGAPPAVDAGPPAVDVPVSFQSWAAAELDRQRADSAHKPDAPHVAAATPNVCPCGERCECEACTCPDCPHRKENGAKLHNAATVVKSPDNGLVLCSQPWCIHCPAAKASAKASGLTVAVIEGDAATQLATRAGATKIEDDGSVTVNFPAWVHVRDGKAVGCWVGVSNAAGVRIMHAAALKPVESVRVTQDAQRHEAAKPVQTQPPPMVMRGDYHTHVCRRCGHSWSHHDSNSGKAAPHRCANCGNYEYRIQSHSGLAPASSGPVTYQMQSGGCPGGVCGQRSGLFGFGLFR